MTNFAIRTTNLGKYYPTRKSKGFGTSFSAILKRINPFQKQEGKTISNTCGFHALQDINFEVTIGESIGIIGRNGAGKSTLLKLISEITKPTSGEIWIQGRIASVLDVGVGFHPDLSGRENVYHTGALLGMRKKEIDEKLDKIFAFSDIGSAVDIPVKKYSSGMYLRLAFSIAIHIDAEILIFDEVLTVGDAAFRIKAIEAIREYIKNRKSTVLIVSHNLSEITDLCDKTIWLESGKLMQYGPTSQVISAYIEHILKPQTDTKIHYITSNENIQLKTVSVTAKNKSNLEMLDTEDELIIKILFEKKTDGNDIDVGFTLSDNIGNKVFLSSSAFTSNINNTQNQGSYQAVSIIPPRLLNSGSFMLNILIIENKKDIIVRLTNAAVFRIELHPHDPSKSWGNVLPGPLKPNLKWEITKEA